MSAEVGYYFTLLGKLMAVSELRFYKMYAYILVFMFRTFEFGTQSEIR